MNHAPADPEFHKLASIFPLLAPLEFAALVADIRAQGLLVPIVVFEGKIIDGRNRLLACREAGVEPRFRDWDGPGEPLAAVLSLNQRRRRIGEGALALAPARTAQICAMPLSGAAKILDVRLRTAQFGKEVLEHGVPGLVALVDRNEVKVSAAALVARLAPDEQSELMAGGPEAIRARASAIRGAVRKPQAVEADPAAEAPTESQAAADVESTPGRGPSRARRSAPRKARRPRRSGHRPEDLPQRAALADPGPFDRMVRLYYDMHAVLERHGLGALNPAELLRARVQDWRADPALPLRLLKDPREWPVCSSCHGKQMDERGVSCWSCAGFGVLLNFDRIWDDATARAMTESDEQNAAVDVELDVDAG